MNVAETLEVHLSQSETLTANAYLDMKRRVQTYHTQSFLWLTKVEKDTVTQKLFP